MRRLFVCLALATVACSSNDESPPAAASAPDPIALAVPVDEDPDPAVLSVKLEAREATKSYGTVPTKVWSYDGTVPGPLLDAKVGDRVVVSFTNSLPEPTTIHWHGLRLPAAMDGTPAMQSPVPPGGTFRYEFTLKDAGLFWYHPHVRGDLQVQRGLHGAIRVRAANEPEVDHERVLVLDDLRLAKDGSIDEYLDDEGLMMGREGNTLLVNGVPKPTIDVPNGGLVRFRIVNVANGRFFNLHVPDHTLRVIGTDGGFVPEPFDTERLLVAPGERYDVVFVPHGAPGAELTVVNEPYDRGHDSGSAPPMDVMKLRLVAGPAAPKPMPTSFAAIERLPDGAPSTTIALNETIRDGKLLFTINDAVYPDVPPLVFSKGSLQVLEVRNDSEMDHPFHVHGTFFQLLAKNGVPEERLAQKDTIIVPMKSTLKLVSRFEEPGKWMYHCHILEHAEGGMMGEIHVE